MKHKTGLAWLPGIFFASFVAQAETLEFDCLLEPYMLVNLGTPVPGILSAVPVDRGDVVRKNAVLARIDSRAEEAAVELARARVEFAKRRITRNDELYRDGLVSSQERDELVTESQLAELELTERTVQLEIRTIRSPVNGVIVERVRSPGDFVQDTEILRLAQIHPLNVEATVPVAHLGRITKGMEATVTPLAPGHVARKAAVTVVDKVVDAASNTFRVRLEIPNRDLEIPAGLRCRVAFELNAE